MHESRRTWTCHLCSGEVVGVSGFSQFVRVTSDCRPWKRGGALGVCRTCASVVKDVDAGWQNESEEIYSNYAMFHQAAGSEQLVYSEQEGSANFRSDPLVARLRDVLSLPQRGRLLDVGCGNGVFLRAFSRAMPDWNLEGSDLNAATSEIVLAIPGVRAMHTRGLDAIENHFDLISLVHVLEHVPHPAEFLRMIRERFRESGLLFIEVPNFTERPFDLLVADHCSHFTPESLNRLLTKSSLDPVSLSGEWSKNEVSGVFRSSTGENSTRLTEQISFEKSFRALVGCTEWLEQTLALANRMEGQESFGIFGTAVGATWLASSLARPIDFFVDEDPSRQGRVHMNAPILCPAEVPKGSTVFMCLPYRQAQSVRARLSQPTTRWRAVLPAAFA